MKKSIQLTFIFILCSSGIIREDVSLEQHIKFAKQKQFSSALQIFKNGKPSGSGVLISPNHILTTAHTFMDADIIPDSFEIDGMKVVTYRVVNERIAQPDSIQISINNKMVNIVKIDIHPKYLRKKSKGSCDLAIITLTNPITNIQPAILSTSFDELGSKVVSVGFGVFGKAHEPHNIKHLNIKIAGENMIDSLGGFILKKQHTLLLADMDHPKTDSLNKMGSAKPLPLEILNSGGDSGGPLYRKDKDGNWKLIGITQGASTSITQIMQTGYYGQVSDWTRISVFHDWILKTIS